MKKVHDHPAFRTDYSKLAGVRLNPARHTAPHAMAHCEQVAERAGALARENNCNREETATLINLAYVHDIGKITGTSHPSESVALLERYGIDDPVFVNLVKYHDINLPWHQSAERGEAPTLKAWRKLASRVDVRQLCLFMVADRVDCPGGWRKNAPLVWFLDQVKKRGLLERDLVLDPSPSRQPALGIDIGRVIMAPVDSSGNVDTSFLGGTLAEALETPPSEDAFPMIRMLTARFEGRVWLVSKAGSKVQERTRQWLAHHRFFERTGVPPANLRFCRHRHEKVDHCKELGLTHFIDDRLEVLRYMKGVVPHLYLFGTQRGATREEHGDWVTPVLNWREVMKHFQAVDPMDEGMLILNGSTTTQENTD